MFDNIKEVWNGLLDNELIFSSKKWSRSIKSYSPKLGQGYADLFNFRF